MVQAAENLHQKIWGKDFKTILKDVRDYDSGATSSWKCVPEEDLKLLELDKLGYTHDGLLIRAEYETIFTDLCSKEKKKKICRGVVLTGQRGSGESCR